MTPQPTYKTRKDGSIDYGHYITRSHALRSQEAHVALDALKRAIKSVFQVRPVIQPGPNGYHVAA